MSGNEAHKQTSQSGGARPRHAGLALGLAFLAMAMVGASFAAVPLYRIFCQVTGYAGTTQRAEKGSDTVLDRTIKVRFDANVARTLPWRFTPEKTAIDVKIGESTLAFYKTANLSARSITGTATYNVTPEIVGSYFNKIECFCFSEQTLGAGEKVEMPVTFFIDPAIMDDPEASHVTEVTLSYTFFPMEKEPDVAATVSGGKGS